jgi:hypothetical protein
MLHMFHTHVTSVFIWMLRMCCNGFQVFHMFFASISDACSKRFICLHTYVAVLYLDVSKVDMVLHLPPRLMLPRIGVSFSRSAALHPSQTAEVARRARWRGRIGGWLRRRKRALSPSITWAPYVTRIDSASISLVFLLRGMLR